MDEREKPLDDALRKLYRGLPRVDPPPAIDAAVLAAAHVSVATQPRRNWAVPVSLAAVLVFSVAVTLRVAEEEPGVQSLQVSPPPSSSAPTAPKPVVPSADAPATEPAAQTKPPSPPANAQRERIAKPKAPAEERAAMAAPPAFVPSPQTDSVQSHAPAAATGQSPPLAERSAARTDRAPMMAKSAASEASLASAAALAPEAWLARIVEMRAQGRHKEADESYAEFRRRFPDYTISPEMMQKITPPR